MPMTFDNKVHSEGSLIYIVTTENEKVATRRVCADTRWQRKEGEGQWGKLLAHWRLSINANFEIFLKIIFSARGFPELNYFWSVLRKRTFRLGNNFQFSVVFMGSVPKTCLMIINLSLFCRTLFWPNKIDLSTLCLTQVQTHNQVETNQHSSDWSQSQQSFEMYTARPP